MPNPPVVVVVDDRPATAAAVDWAAREAARRRTAVRVVTLVGARPDPIERARAHGRLARARRTALGVEAVVTSAAIVSEQELREIGRDGSTVVVGGGPPEGPELGALLAAATAPVVVVPSSGDPRRHDGEVIAAVDPADDDEVRRCTLTVAAATAYRWGRPLLVAVVGPASHPTARAARRTFDASADDAGPHVAVHEVFGHGDPAAELAALVGPSTGLLVLGGLGRTGCALVEDARCPVMVVPAAPAAAPAASVPAAPSAVGGEPA